jgi:hypothetical protein
LVGLQNEIRYVRRRSEVPMQTISFETIQTAIDDVCSINTEDELDQLSQDLFDAQPGIGGFVIDFIEDMTDDAKDLGFMMALVLWKSFQQIYPDMRVLTEDEVVSRFEAQESDLQKLLEVDDDMIDELSKVEAAEGQPEIFNYVTQELFSDGEDEIKLTEDEEVHLFMILRFISTVFNDMAKEVAGGGGGLKH